MMLSPHPMDHAQKRALQGTNEITGLGLRPLRLSLLYTSLFLARCAATFVVYPAQNLVRPEFFRKSPNDSRASRTPITTGKSWLSLFFRSIDDAFTIEIGFGWRRPQ